MRLQLSAACRPELPGDILDCLMAVALSGKEQGNALPDAVRHRAALLSGCLAERLVDIFINSDLCADHDMMISRICFHGNLAALSTPCFSPVGASLGRWLAAPSADGYYGQAIRGHGMTKRRFRLNCNP